MSDTLMVWKPQPGLCQANAYEIFRQIAEGEITLPHDAALDRFLADILAANPPLEALDADSPSHWAVTPFVADGHVALGIGGDIITMTCDAVQYAFAHDLIVYDPQIDKLYDRAWDEECTRQDEENRRRAGEIP
jgi:hypothetical protein